MFYQMHFHRTLPATSVVEFGGREHINTHKYFFVQVCVPSSSLLLMALLISHFYAFLQQAVIPRAIRTTVPTIPANVRFHCLPLFVRQCIKTYTADWHKVLYKSSVYSGTYKELLRLVASSLKFFFTSSKW